MAKRITHWMVWSDSPGQSRQGLYFIFHCVRIRTSHRQCQNPNLTSLPHIQPVRSVSPERLGVAAWWCKHFFILPRRRCGVLTRPFQVRLTEIPMGFVVILPSVMGQRLLFNIRQKYHTPTVGSLPGFECIIPRGSEIELETYGR